MARFKILAVDDEKFARHTIASVLESEGMTIAGAGDGIDAVCMAMAQEFDLIILDIVMEWINGSRVVYQLHSCGILTPVFILSGSQADNDKVFALGTGADGYITKPFSFVLCAKAEAYLRRMKLSNQGGESDVITTGPLCYLCDEMRLLKNGEEIALSGKESFLMRYFLTNQNKVLTREQIYNGIWSHNVADDNTIVVHIRRLRTKIEGDPNQSAYLKTVHGVGCQFSA